MSTLEAKGISAWIQINEERLECYSPSSGKSATGDAPVMNCWIASQVGEKFSVVLSTPRETLKNDYVAFLNIDGHRLSDRIVSRADMSDFTWWNGAREGDIRRPFIFASPTVTDDDTLLDSLESAQNSKTGEIRVQLYRITGLHDIVAPTVKQYTLPAVQTVHETSVKATRPLHQISLGEGEPEIYRSNIRYAYTKRHECLVTFVFRYRPMETLIENGIALPPDDSTGNRYISEQGSGTERSTDEVYISVAPKPGAVEPQAAESTSSLLPRPRSTQSKSSSQLNIPHFKLESEFKANDQDVRPEVHTVLDSLEDEEQRLMEQLASVRKRKRDALQDVQTELPAKTLKTDLKR